ncbi:hypothetical protein FQN60_009932 [Etheostoma spectabile]|uniref:Uncharacterized protein n=1 Tax=Etheostoma spectabile TaxID=54343 RepID=A0A5J5D3I3_9PERO|nr:hypothetical protein FQN60_009932 [Etheostoma spectabile]
MDGDREISTRLKSSISRRRFQRRAGVSLCQAAGKLNKQPCLFITKGRGDE